MLGDLLGLLLRLGEVNVFFSLPLFSAFSFSSLFFFALICLVLGWDLNKQLLSEAGGGVHTHHCSTQTLGEWLVLVVLAAVMIKTERVGQAGAVLCVCLCVCCWVYVLYE